MAAFAIHGDPVNTAGELPARGARAPAFELTGTDFSAVTPEQFQGRTLVLNIFPSLDTPVCANSVRRFNQEAANRKGVSVLCVSADLPFAQSRFCGAEGLEDVITASTFRNPEFGRDYGVAMVDGPLAGLMSRAVVVIDADGRVAYTEQVPEISEEPDYDQALQHLG